MIKKCILREVRVVAKFYFRRYDFFPWYFIHIKLSEVITYIRYDITASYISVSVAEFPSTVLGLSIIVGMKE